MDAANDQNAKLRELNSRFIKELREARHATGAAVAAAEKHRDAADAPWPAPRAGKHAAQARRDQLTGELNAAKKATSAAEAAAEKRAVAGAEAATLAAADNARLRDVNVELVKALKLAQKESKDSQKALVAADLPPPRLMNRPPRSGTSTRSRGRAQGGRGPPRRPRRP